MKEGREDLLPLQGLPAVGSLHHVAAQEGMQHTCGRPAVQRSIRAGPYVCKARFMLACHCRSIHANTTSRLPWQGADGGGPRLEQPKVGAAGRGGLSMRPHPRYSAGAPSGLKQNT